MSRAIIELIRPLDGGERTIVSYHFQEPHPPEPVSYIGVEPENHTVPGFSEVSQRGKGMTHRPPTPRFSLTLLHSE